ncbi:BrnT family toxin [Duganella sp. sic0402]|uniref:BrnT family toxin n=1 Tax=Duganella sp. sic0402 TaxID=2854786 RepID=UPI001C45E416|nr:BrnT family toxin [Duganella sp. sic0402]
MTIYFWDEAKRKSNLRSHGLDFADCRAIIEDSRSVTIEDKRYLYNERRFLTLGSLRGQELAVIYTERNDGIRIISFRKTTRKERRTLFGRS